MAPTRVGSWLWLVALALGGVPDFCAAKRSFTVADDIGLTLFALGAASVSFSLDGHYFAVISVRGLLDSNRPESTLRIFQTEDVEHFLSRPIGSRLPTPVWSISKSTYKDGPIISDIRWLPKPDALAFMA